MALMSLGGFKGLTPAQQQQVQTTWAAYNNPQGNQISNTLNSFSTGNANADMAKDGLSFLASAFNWSFGGHSDYYNYDMALQGNKNVDRLASIASSWKDRGFTQNSIWLKPITNKESPEYVGLNRIQALAKFYKNNNPLNVSMAIIINDAVKLGVLPQENFINSEGIMAPEPGIVNNLTSGTNSKFLLIGGGLLVAYLLFKRK